MRLRSFRSLRLRLRLLFFSVAAFLLLVGTDLHRRAEARRRRALVDRIDLLERRLETRISQNEAREDEKNGYDPTARNDLSHARQIGDETNIFPRPRIVGGGRSGSWVYLDVRLPSWETRRYFLRRTASRMEKSRWLRSICADVEDDYYLLSMQSTAESSP